VTDRGRVELVQDPTGSQNWPTSDHGEVTSFRFALFVEQRDGRMRRRRIGKNGNRFYN
jgi:hypothetical protein